MGKKVLCLLLLLIITLPVPVNAAFSDDINNFKQKYAEIYHSIDPDLAVKMDMFLPDVVDYVIHNYDEEQSIDIQIKNGLGSVLLTGDVYKNDLLPFLMEQSKNKDLYKTHLKEMQAIVHKEVLLRLSNTNQPDDASRSGSNNIQDQEVIADKLLQNPENNNQTEPDISAIPVVFRDISEHWAKPYIEKMATYRFISGVGPGIFEPDRNITRAEFSAILLRTLGVKSSTPVMGRFLDVAADEWYFDIINTAADMGLINGYSATHFGPDDPITREQMAMIISNAMGYKGKYMEAPDTGIDESLKVFNDAMKISSWARTGVAMAIQEKIIMGRDNNTFGPQENATRAEASIMLLKMGTALNFIN